MRLAIVSPLPPTPTGIADYTIDVAQALGSAHSIELFHDQDQVSASLPAPAFRIDELQEGHVGIGAGGDPRGVELRAVLQSDATDNALSHQDPPDRRIRADRRAVAPRRRLTLPCSALIPVPFIPAHSLFALSNCRQLTVAL